MHNKNTARIRAIMVISLFVLLIGIIIYKNFYQININVFEYVFISRIEESPDKQHAITITIYRTDKDNNISYIMGTLGTSDDMNGHSKNPKTIFWQKADSDSLQNIIINEVIINDWIDVKWIDAQNVIINGISLNINDNYDYRRN